MLLRVFLFLSGFGLMIIGFSTMILYINLLGFGYNFKEYLGHMIKMTEFYYLLIGFILLNISIFIKGGKNEKRL
ncbi:MAG: hypothetical protein U0M66_01335 [Bacilli bacterium]|nr:hypothetical protein [Bacilli bacterium]